MRNDQMIRRLNEALEQEHACYIRYKTHAAIITGPYSKEVSDRLMEIAQDESDHADQLRARITILGGTPTMSVHTEDLILAESLEDIIRVNLDEERKAISMYLGILDMIPKDQIRLYKTIEHIIRDEQEHMEELERFEEHGPEKHHGTSTLHAKSVSRR